MANNKLYELRDQGRASKNYNETIRNIGTSLAQAVEIVNHIENTEAVNLPVLEDLLNLVVSVVAALNPDKLAPTPMPTRHSVTDPPNSQYLLGTQERLASDPR